MSLDDLIPGEVVDCKLAHALTRLAARPDIKTIIEIGSSSGDGSTAAIVKGMEKNPGEPLLDCIELSEVRFDALMKNVGFNVRINRWLGCSVDFGGFMSEEQVSYFYRSHNTNLNKYPLQTVLGWREQDKEYLHEHNSNLNLLEFILRRNETDRDTLMVFIDGSAFTAKKELELLYGAKIVVLDDVNDIKGFDNYHRLTSDPNYMLIEEDWNLRNGFAVFELRK